MKSIILITKDKIIASKVSEAILKKHPYSKFIEQNNDKELFLGKYPRNFYIIFEDSRDIDGEDGFEDKKMRQFIPYEHAQINNLYFHHHDIAKSVVSIINEIYQDLLIYDIEKGLVVTPQEYINNQ